VLQAGGFVSRISSSFGRFYHGVVLKQALDAARQIYFREWKDNNTGGCLTFYKYEDYYDLEDLKNIFKLMNLNYPLDADGKTSTTEITSKELSLHIEWVLKIMGENGIELDFIREEWDRILLNANIRKEAA